MSPVAAGVIVQPKIDYVTSDDGKSITYKAEVKSEGRGLVAQLLAVP